MVSCIPVLSPLVWFCHQYFIQIYIYYNEVLSELSLLLQLVRFQTHTADVVTGRNGYTSPGFGAGKCWEGVFIPRWWSCVSMMLKYYNYYLLFSPSKTGVQETGSGSPSKYTFKSYMIVSHNLDKTWWNSGMKENKKCVRKVIGAHRRSDQRCGDSVWSSTDTQRFSMNHQINIS